MAEGNRWEDARNDLKAYAGSVPFDRRVWAHLATAQLRLGDRAGYGKTCAQVLELYGKIASPFEADQTAWVLALADAPGRDWKQALELVDLALRQPPNRYGYLHTRGVLLYRAENYEEALKQLDEARKAYTGALGLPPGAAKEDGSATDQLFLAMTYHHLKRPDEAKLWLDKAVKWLDGVQQAKTVTGPTIWQRTEWDLHRKEAEKLIGPAK